MASRMPVPTPVPAPPPRDRDRRPSRPRRPPPGSAADPYGGPLSPDGSNTPAASVPVISERELLTLYGLESMDTDRWVDLDPIAPLAAVAQPEDTSAQPSTSASRAGSQSNLTATPGGGNQLYLDDTDPLRLKPSIFRSLPRSLPNVTRDHLCIAHKDFDPKKFLSNVHAGATFRDLDYGLAQLLDTNDEHAAGMRTLVRSHFDDFVVAKSTVDDAFRGWTERELDPATHYGTDAFSDTLDIATSTVTQVFGPILERRRQAERIKSTLAVLERFKFFFNLPAGLRAHVAAGRWMEAVRDYKKGKALMAGMYPDLVAGGGGPDAGGLRSALPGGATAAAPSTNTPGRVQQKMLFETIWMEVVRVMATLQDRLMRQLTEQHANRSADEQEAAIALVLDIDPGADPVWAYLESRFKWILSQLKERVSMWYREMPLNTAKPERFTEAQFRRAVHLRNKKEYDVLFAKDPEVQAWSARSALVADLTQALVHSLPDFWKLAKGYIEGKYTSKSAGASSNLQLPLPGNARGRGGAGRGFAALDLVKVEQCHKMVKDMAAYFGMLIQHALTLSAPASGPASPASPRPPISPLPPGLVLPGAASTTSLSSLPQLPPLTCVNSVTVAVFAPRMAAHMHACADAVRGVKVPPDTLSSVVVAMERAKAGVLEMMLGAWMADVKVLPGLEDWRLEGPTGGAGGGAGAGSVTPIIPLFASYQKGMVQAAFKVARPLTPPGTSVSTGGGADGSAPAGSVSVTGAKLGSLIVPAFFETTVQFLDAMHALVATDPATNTTAKKLSFPPALPAADHWTWLALHVTCNLDHLDHVLLPSLVTLVEGLAACKLPAERAHLTDVVARMDQALMHAVLRRITATLDAHVAQGFPTPSTGVATSAAAVDGGAQIQIRPWVFQVLLHLVNVHALCTRVFGPLTSRVLSAAFTALSTSVLDRVRKLDALASTGQLLQVTVEVEFLHQTLVRFETPASKEALEAVYFTLGGMYRPEAGAGGKVNEAEVVKRVLGEAIRGTAVMFACFGGVQAEAAVAIGEGGGAEGERSTGRKR